MNNLEVIDRIKKYMLTNDLKQVDIIRESGGTLSKSKLSKELNGKQDVEIDLLKTISKISGYSINYWITGNLEHEYLMKLRKQIMFYKENDILHIESARNVLHTLLEKEIEHIIEKEQFK